MANEKDVEAFEERKEYMRKESEGAYHDNSEFPSSDDIAGQRGDGTNAEPSDVPGKDEVASDAETPAEELHGSLHGRWTATDEKQS
jgi:hypothetical protein